MKTFPNDPLKKSATQNSVFITKIHQKPIDITIGVIGLEIRMDLTDFLDAAMMEMPNPILIVTKTQLLSTLTTAFHKVFEQMKKETARV